MTPQDRTIIKSEAIANLEGWLRHGQPGILKKGLDRATALGQYQAHHITDDRYRIRELLGRIRAL